MLERNGLRIAAISYDSPDGLQAFAEKYQIAFPLLAW
jgi:peroxiredoxin